MSPAVAKRLRLLASVLTLLAVAVAAAGAWFYWRVGRALAQLEGHATLAGLSQPVVVERDALGVPTLRGTSRLDVARALGFVHAQERYFQMDAARRRAAGELSELVGRATLDVDRSARLHGFRPLARSVLAQLPAPQQALLEAYTAGVNQGLSQLKAAPFEYLLLKGQPQPWKAEDCVLLIYAMTLDLQSATANYEQSLTTLRDELGSKAVEFFAPLVGPEDAALDGSTAPLASPPTERMLDLRKREKATSEQAALPIPGSDPPARAGSNCYALAGDLTASGAGLLASDMHLDLRVPNIWFRASLTWTGDDGKARRITGVTLPGTPVVVAGSNGHVAWGFTNADVDVADLALVNLSDISEDIYVKESELLPVETRNETIQIKGEPADVYRVNTTIWGPIVGRTSRGRPLAMKWTMHDPAAANFNLQELEEATTVEEALAVAKRAGIPVQSFSVVDRSGAVGWTIAGKIPKRVGYDGRFPVPWTFGDRKWEGFLSADEVPSYVYRPGGTKPASGPLAEGRIWSANQRMVAGDALARFGDGGYERPYRAARARDLLRLVEKGTPKDLLAVQLDHRSIALDRWHAILVRTLTDEAVAKNKQRRALREALAGWQGLASPDSVSYRLVRNFRTTAVRLILDPIFEPCRETYPHFSYARFGYEPAVWQLLEQKPAHLLNTSFSTWEDLLLAAADEVLNDLDARGTPLKVATWDEQNKPVVRHPLSSGVPLLGKWLDMPRLPLPGDVDVPRVQKTTNGASERFVVSPGREEEGIFHMPTGQSANPRSPFYGAGHEAWAQGLPTPFLPGEVKYTLTLRP